ncbi:ABC transporter substrate-binding protein [Treponema primitia]|nr:ABC transporter substrate-binding protein [Treponema primitia]
MKKSLLCAARPLVAGLALALLLAGGVGSVYGGGKSQAGGTPRADNTLRVSLNRSVKTLDPLYLDSTAADNVIGQLGDTLVRNNKGRSDFFPDLATDWTISEDGKTYVFNLRKGVLYHPGKFQNGRELAPADVVYCLNRAKGYFSNYLYMLGEVEVTGPYQVTCHLNVPDANFLYNLTSTTNTIFPPEEQEGWGQDFATHFIGTGPYILESHIPDQKSTMVRNEKYWGTKANIERVEYYIISDTAQRVNALRTGEIDVDLNVVGETIQTVKDNSSLTLYQNPAFRVNLIGFNTRAKGPLSDPRVRKALIQATDYDTLAKGVFRYNEGTVQKLPLPNNSWGYDKALEALVPAYNPTAAKALLAEAGYPNGFKVTINYVGTGNAERAVTILQALWKDALNVELVPVTTEQAVYMEILQTGSFELQAGSQGCTSDPATSLGYFFSTDKIGGNYNPWGYSNPAIDAKIALAVAIPDRTKRIQLYHEILEQVVPENVGIFYANEKLTWGVTNRVKNVEQWAAILDVTKGIQGEPGYINLSIAN